jgi:hypothetical protein
MKINFRKCFKLVDSTEEFNNHFKLNKVKMKARIIGLMLMAGILISGNPASAQLKDLLNKGANNLLDQKQKKAQEEKKRKEEAEKKKNAEQQTQPENKEQTQQPTSPPANNYMQTKMMGMMGMTVVKHEDNYAFTSSMTMEMQSTDSLGKKSDKVLYTNYFDKNSRNFSMEFESTDKQSGQKQKSLMIFDYKNWVMLILSGKSGDKSGIGMQMEKDSAQKVQQKQADQQTAKPERMYYKPTGRTKTIAGYSCKEYLYENPEGKSEIWTTKDVAFDYSSAWGHMGGMQTLASGGTTYGMGMVMEMHTYDKHSKAQSDLTVVEIKPNNPKSFNLAGYQIMGMKGTAGQGQGQRQEKPKSKK